METFECEVTLGNESGDKFETVGVQVGTGCTFSHFPRSLLHRLGISPRGTATLSDGDGTVVEMEIGDSRIRIDDRQGPATVVFDNDGTKARLGKVTLSGLCMRIDSEQKQLVKYLPRVKPSGWYEHQRKLKEAIERIEAERKGSSAQTDTSTAKGE